jgi:preprotein translocase subunit SecG
VIVVIKYLLLILEVVIGFLLVGAILLQRSKDQGLGGLAFGAGVGEAFFGARAGNVIVRATVVLAAIFFLNTVVLARIYSGAGSRISVPKPLVARPAAAPAQNVPAEQAAAPAAPNQMAMPSAGTEVDMSGAGATVPSASMPPSTEVQMPSAPASAVPAVDVRPPAAGAAPVPEATPAKKDSKN